MKCKTLILHSVLALLTSAAILAAPPRVLSQDSVAPNTASPDRDRDNDVTRQELANFDRFLDSHPEIAEQLRKNPALVDDKQFVANHPDLQSFLKDHPGVREEYKEHPYAFMKDEERYDRHEDQGRMDVTRQELANFDHFLDSHPEIAEQLQKNPALVDDRQFVNNHEALKSFLADHPGVREEYKEHPYAFMRDENRYEHHENGMGGGNNAAQGEVASFGGFLQNHDKVADDLSRNPSLANNQEYLENHPELKSYLQQHPQANQQLNQNPQEFIASAQQFKTPTGTEKMATEPKMK